MQFSNFPATDVDARTLHLAQSPPFLKDTCTQKSVFCLCHVRNASFIIICVTSLEEKRNEKPHSLNVNVLLIKSMPFLVHISATCVQQTYYPKVIYIFSYNHTIHHSQGQQHKALSVCNPITHGEGTVTMANIGHVFYNPLHILFVGCLLTDKINACTSSVRKEKVPSTT